MESPLYRSVMRILLYEMLAPLSRLIAYPPDTLLNLGQCFLRQEILFKKKILSKKRFLPSHTSCQARCVILSPHLNQGLLLASYQSLLGPSFHDCSHWRKPNTKLGYTWSRVTCPMTEHHP
jgi:hypothetical protein